MEGCLPLVALSNADAVVRVLEIEFGEDYPTGKETISLIIDSNIGWGCRLFTIIRPWCSTYRRIERRLV